MPWPPTGARGPTGHGWFACFPTVAMPKRGRDGLSTSRPHHVLCKSTTLHWFFLHLCISRSRSPKGSVGQRRRLELEELASQQRGLTVVSGAEKYGITASHGHPHQPRSRCQHPRPLADHRPAGAGAHHLAIDASNTRLVLPQMMTSLRVELYQSHWVFTAPGIARTVMTASTGWLSGWAGPAHCTCSPLAV